MGLVSSVAERAIGNRFGSCRFRKDMKPRARFACHRVRRDRDFDLHVFAGTRADGLFENGYSTPATPTSWGKVKDMYRK